MSSSSRSIPINVASRYPRSSRRRNSIEEDMDKDEVPNTTMSASYSEILNVDIPTESNEYEYSNQESHKKISNSNSTDDELQTGETIDSEPNEIIDHRPKSLLCDSSFPYNLEGTISKDGDVTNFVAKDLEHKIRLSSPSTKDSPSHNSTSPSTSGIMTRHFLSSQNLPQIDSNVLNDIEIEAQYLAASADNLIENLGNLLHSISSITSDNVEVHKNAVSKLTDCMDANIKIMYTIMAKTEEITESMKPTEQVAQRIQQIKRFVDMLESNL
ncbi:BLOC-1-related complex subunit 6 [Condylostylus longicornis]|uniref:BLOC-1-related complex subunit 6 n=1 Tax=Condylostylus longicornis TaxID=2530218 RepID=UPI00244DE8FF|nr:BLOC-1-related complex subunit 6 [Condylostylus longicornis]